MFNLDVKKSSLIVLILLSISLIFFYWSSFNNFFFQDDFYNLSLSQKQNLLDAFNLFKKPVVDFYFYRPFSTQLYWSFGRALFGLSPLGYHIVNFVFFLISILFVYILTNQILSDKKASLLASFFYAYSGSHFYRLFFLSQFQELSLAVFTFATLILFYKKSLWTPFLFALALMAKETAVMIVPFIFLATLLMKGPKRKHFRLFFYCLGILSFYFYARIFFFGFARGGVYEYDFGLRKVINNFFWYGLWSLGIPESFVNVKIFQLPTIINPQVFTKFESWGNPTLSFFGLFIVLIFFQVKTLLKNFDRKVLLAIASFILFLLPVAFFPFHKFPYSLSVPLLGSSIFLASITSRLKIKSLVIICIAYLLLAFSANQFNLSNHWAVKKASTAEAVFDYFKKNYPIKLTQANIYFRNTTVPVCLSIIDGPRFSQEVSYGIGGADGLRLLYNDENLPVYFEDLDRYKYFSSNSLVVDSRPFFR